MILHRIKKYILLLAIVFSAATLFGQNTLSLMNGVPQAIGTNPAIQHPAKVYVGFPGLSSINFNLLNKGFRYSDLIHKGEGAYKDSLILDVANLLDVAKDENYLSPDIRLEILSFGFQVQDMYFRVAINNRTFMKLNYPINTIKFATSGNKHVDFLGKNADIGGLKLNMFNYTDIAISGSKQITEDITVGVGLKYLMGHANIYTEKMDVSLYTDADTYDMTFTTDVAINMALPLNVTLGEDGYVEKIDMDDPDIMSDFVFSKNNGFAVDLGAVYKMDKQTTFYASLIDVGKINWKNNMNNLVISNTVTFDGLDMTPLINGDNKEFDVGGQMEELTNDFNILHTEKSYSTWLPSTLYLGGEYKVTDFFTAGGMLRSVFYDHSMSPALTISGKVNYMQNCSAILSYSMMNGRYDNIGLGLNFRFMYIVTDNIIGFFFPQNTNTVSFRFGLNLPFGYKTKELPEKASVEKSGID